LRPVRASLWIRPDFVFNSHPVFAKHRGLLAYGSTPRRFNSFSTASKAISSGRTAIVVQLMIAARVRIKKGIIRLSNDGG
jgi:hypothetical protein